MLHSARSDCMSISSVLVIDEQTSARTEEASFVTGSSKNWKLYCFTKKYFKKWTNLKVSIYFKLYSSVLGERVIEN